jgi:hypothetical protein
MTESNSTVQITLSVEQLKSLIHEAVREALLEMMGEDASSEPQIAPEMVARLQRYRVQRPVTISVDEVEKVLLDD